MFNRTYVLQKRGEKQRLNKKNIKKWDKNRFFVVKGGELWQNLPYSGG